MKYIKFFETITHTDVSLVGGKNASLGQMIHHLSQQGIQIPRGFAITVEGYWRYVQVNELDKPLRDLLVLLTDHRDTAMLKKVGTQIRDLFARGTIPEDLAHEIAHAYDQLCAQYGMQHMDVAVRSSATAEDLPTASFAGQQDTFLNVRGIEHLLESCKKSYASLFTDRAMVYRIEKGFDHFSVGLSIGIQKMIRADLACSGVAFSLDTESGFKDVVMINASYGLGESIVKGLVSPDEFYVHKPTCMNGFASIVKKYLGDKQVKIVYGQEGQETQKIYVSQEDQNHFCMSDKEILELARMTIVIEQHYTSLYGKWTPMDIEWAKDGQDGALYIVQARPETVHAQIRPNTLTTYTLKKDEKKQVILSGQSIGYQITTGRVRIVTDITRIEELQKGDILVTHMTDPDWVPVMRILNGIITDRGGRTCHAAIVARELGIPAIIGAQGATETLSDGQEITMDCSQGTQGYIYAGSIEYEKHTLELDTLHKPPVELMINIADPQSAFTVAQLPVSGVGLARIEFIISNTIKIHPLALLHPDRIQDTKVVHAIAHLTRAYTNYQNYFIDQLAQGIGMIAAALYPRPTIVRLSDFKSNEYRNLIGGLLFEPEEENPMLGWRGASRYIHPAYKEAFALECAAIDYARTQMGLNNIKVMIPFVRTIEELQAVLKEMERNNIVRGKHNLEIIMMCEVPSNVLLIDEFSVLVDGFSIGSNDLTQFTLGVDRDSALLANLFDERDAAVKKMFAMAIEGAQRNKKAIGICGQAPSDYPEIATYLIELGIDYLSLNPDTVLPFLMR